MPIKWQPQAMLRTTPGDCIVYEVELCVILPVHNAQSSLRDDCCDILEVAAEVADNFGVVIVDNGSVDDTYDIATDMSLEYPQVRVLHLATRNPIEKACSAALRLVKAKTIVAHDGLGPVHAGEILEQCLKSRPEPESADQIAEFCTQSSPGAWLRRYLPWAEAHADLQRVHAKLSGFRRLERPGHRELVPGSQRIVGEYELISS